jgi:putative heme-binding domain-containing protein
MPSRSVCARSLLVLIGSSALLSAQPRSYSAADVDNGRQLFSVHCQPCHGVEGDLIPGVDMRRAQFKRVSSDDEISRLILNGVPGTAMPPTNLPDASRIAVVAFIRSLNDAGAHAAGPGDAQRGKAVFEGKGGCLSCHRVAGKGSRKAPEMTDIGVLRNAASLERSILDPNESILPQHRTVRAVTKNGTVITGLRLNEDTHTLEVIDDNEHLVSLVKSDLREYALLKTSPMPSYQDKLNTQEIADLVTYLLSLKGLP